MTHRGCLDGTGSALMFIWAGGLRENVFFKNPTGCGLTAEEASPFDEVWFADICPPTLHGDCAGGKPYRVFDHHASNARKFDGSPLCTFDMTRSGTSLMAHVLGIDDDYCQNPAYHPVTELIQALEAYDLGRFDNAAGVRLADIASSYSQEEMLEVMAERDPEEILYDRDLTHRAEAMAAIRRLYGDSVMRSGVRWDEIPDGECGLMKVGVAVSPVYWKNEVANRILESGKADVAVIIDPTGGMVSLRANPGAPDVSAVAELYGGGGHARSAGFKAKSWDMLKALMHEAFE